MTAPIEPGHVMSREKYEALQVQWLQEKIRGELMGMLLSSDNVSYEQSCNVPFTPFFSFSIPVQTAEQIESDRKQRKSPPITVKTRSA